MKKYIIFTIMLFLTCITNTYAACTQEEKTNFKKYEDEYKIKYEINKNTKMYNLYFTATKIDTYDFVLRTNSAIECEDYNATTSKCYPFASGEYKIDIIGRTATCNDVIKTITINLPKYNKLADDPLCEGIEDFVLCNPTYEKEIDYDTFVSRVETYKKNHQTEQKKEEEPKKQEKDNSKINEMLDKVSVYFKENWIEITIIGSFVILLLITAIITIKAARKSRYLE